MNWPFIRRSRIEEELTDLEKVAVKRGSKSENPNGYSRGLEAAAQRLRNAFGITKTDEK